MEWLKKLLEAQGLSEAQIKAITEGVETNYKDWIPKHRFDEVNTTKKKAEDDLKDRDKQLEELKKSAGDNKALQDQIAQLQNDNKAAKDKYESEVKDLHLSTALKLALAGKVHDPDIVAGLLDKSKVELDDAGNVKTGLDDQIKALQTSKAFLFVPESSNTPKFKGAKPPDGGGGAGGGGDASVGASFAKAANESGKAPAAAPNPWG
ncbi:phage scaffolding protein [Cohnella nanjingensis]|uniref:Phage scaffolding protein n=1 Tax=Cohnella nanjingensis TaxID=1387779 RepID=A0A7X0VDT1_9BACL|nr:phage scaffolding protein [Cohnella nanjingensis]MBB6670270.1 phage scaffolding protein [Cohnella nanjingensis]